MAGQSRMKLLIVRLRNRLRVDARSASGAASALRASAIGLVVGLAVALLLTGSGSERSLGIGVLLGLVCLVAVVVVVVLNLIRSLPAPLMQGAAMLGVALGLPFVTLVSGPQLAAIVLGAIVVVGTLGGSVVSIRATGWKIVNTLSAVASAIVLATGLGLYLVPGWPVEQAPRPMPVATPPLELSDPAVRGAHAVTATTYGSGSDRHRAEYAADADLISASVDGSKLIDGWDGAAGWARTRYWGFDTTALPLQGRVWAPKKRAVDDGSTKGQAPFPLVLMVHGNHDMEDYSDGGYRYLGSLFASRGFIAVSVDENFLNSSYADAVGGPEAGLEKENDARGWLLLKHLELFRAWNAEPGHRFNGQVDLDRVVLIGHSRGGEAAAEAAAFNDLPRYPDDARLLFDHGFGIRGVAAIAPSDSQYNPRGRETRLNGVSYLVIHGSLDGDVQSFSGAAQYSRVDLGSCTACFKSAVYVVGANHGQFNTSWGRDDFGVPYGQLLNLKPILPPQTQRHVAQVLLSAFLETVLHGDDRYRTLFANPERGRAWLGAPEVIARYSSGSDQVLAAFEEDDDVTTGTSPGVRLDARHVMRWREGEVELKAQNLDSAAVLLGWNARDGEPASFEARVETPLDLGARSVTFELAMSEEAPFDAHVAEEAAEPWTTPASIDFHVELEDVNGATARVALAEVAMLAPPVQSTTRKAAWLDSLDQSETVFRRYAFAAASWTAQNPTFDTARVVAIRFVFDVTPAGVVWLDDLSLSADS